jgi:hypothetical protein
MNKTIYVRDEDVAVWDRARELAGDKLAPVIMAGLKRYVAEQEATAKAFERIEVSFNDAEEFNVPKKKAFYGRWIFPPDKPERFTDDEATTRYNYAVAVTAKGGAAILRWEDYPEGIGQYRFLVFPSLAAAAANSDINWPVRKAIEEIGVPVEELDI